MLMIMKYEWKNGWKNVHSLLIIAAVLSIVIGFILRAFRAPIASIIWFAVMLALLVITIDAIVRNMTTRMFGPEGYLTHLLPVDTWELLIGKAVGTWLFGIFMVFAAAFCWLLMLICNVGFSSSSADLQKVIQALPKLGTFYFNHQNGNINVALGIVGFLILSFLAVIEFQFACIVGRQFAKFEIAAGLIVFVVLSFLGLYLNQTFAAGFVSILVFALISFAGSYWLLKNRLSV